MEHKQSHDLTVLQKDFEQALEELVAVLAEICVHEYLSQKEKETDNVKEK